MCFQYLNYQLKNMYQNANWRQRPMPAEMLQYAAMEAAALLPLQFRLQDPELVTASDHELEFFC